jgi:hypothetical protein
MEQQVEIAATTLERFAAEVDRAASLVEAGPGN